jgi:transcriptional regulator with AAA-type ATPase domain
LEIMQLPEDQYGRQRVDTAETAQPLDRLEIRLGLSDRREPGMQMGGWHARLVLERCHGNKREACRILDISYHTLQSYLRYPIGRDVGTDDVDAEATPTAELKVGPEPSIDAEA